MALEGVTPLRNTNVLYAFASTELKTLAPNLYGVQGAR